MEIPECHNQNFFLYSAFNQKVHVIIVFKKKELFLTQNQYLGIWEIISAKECDILWPLCFQES